MGFIIVSFWWDLLIIFCVLFGIFYTWVRNKYKYWKNRGIEGPEPGFLFGNMTDIFLMRKHLGHVFSNIYFKYKKKPFVGIYMMLEPALFVNDLDLIKRIMVKDFAYFTDHSGDIDFETEPLAGHLFNLGGEKWKKMRAKLSPTFTSNRMRYMFNTLASCDQTMMEYLEVNDTEIVDLKEVMTKFTIDVIGSCAFGIQCNSFKDPYSQFRKMGEKIARPPIIRSLIMLLVTFVPRFSSFIKVSAFGKDVNDFFFNLVRDTVAYREKHNIVRNDFLQLLMKLRKDGVIEDEEFSQDKNVDEDMHLTISELAAQVFIFFLAGFETSSSTASFCLYELALNPDIQKTLTAEIHTVLAKNEGKISYESLNEMSYLSMVIEETLRKYSPATLISRKCTKEYTIPGTDVVIEKDVAVLFSNFGAQNDPEYFPDPKKFDPERFSQENKENRHHFANIPFGEGPRVCIGNRFALMQTKLGVVSILLKYEVAVCNKTPIPMEFDKKTLILMSENPVWLKLKKRHV